MTDLHRRLHHIAWVERIEASLRRAGYWEAADAYRNLVLPQARAALGVARASEPQPDLFTSLPEDQC